MKPQDYDSIVVGAGAGGGIAAGVLAESGRSVLLLERGPHETYASAGHRDHLRNQRLSTYGHNAGPGHRRQPARRRRRRRRPPAPSRRTRPATRTTPPSSAAARFVYGGQAWRFLPKDFRMASTYGVPAGSSLTDWPFPYDDLAPWYERAEWEIGVAGDSPAIGGDMAARARLPDAAGAARPRRRGARSAARKRSAHRP